MALLERTEELTVSSALAMRATRDPDHPYLVFEGGRVGFGEVDGQAEALAAARASSVTVSPANMRASSSTRSSWLSGDTVDRVMPS